jgi:hypothetical protein
MEQGKAVPPRPEEMELMERCFVAGRDNVS